MGVASWIYSSINNTGTGKKGAGKVCIESSACVPYTYVQEVVNVVQLDPPFENVPAHNIVVV